MYETRPIDRPGHLRTFVSVIAVGAAVYAAYQWNGGMKPLEDTWQDVRRDFGGVTNVRFDSETYGRSSQAADKAIACLSGSGAGVARVESEPDNNAYTVLVRQAGSAALDLVGAQECLDQTSAADIKVRLVVVK